MGYAPSCLNIFIGRDDDETLTYLMRSNNRKKKRKTVMVLTVVQLCLQLLQLQEAGD
jgi:hypothetical protein